MNYEVLTGDQVGSSTGLTGTGRVVITIPDIHIGDYDALQNRLAFNATEVSFDTETVGADNHKDLGVIAVDFSQLELRVLAQMMGTSEKVELPAHLAIPRSVKMFPDFTLKKYAKRYL
jgi:hypothetical protein